MDSVEDLKASQKIDGYLHFEFPKPDASYKIGVDNFKYWKKQWGVSLSGIAKGIAVLKLDRCTHERNP